MNLCNNRFKIQDRTERNENFLQPSTTVIIEDFNISVSTTNKLISWMSLKFKTSTL